MAQDENNTSLPWCNLCGDHWIKGKHQAGQIEGYVSEAGDYQFKDFRLCPKCVEKIVLAVDTSKIF